MPEWRRAAGLILMLAALSMPAGVRAQAVPRDSGAVVVRRPPDGVLEALRRDPDFDYEHARPATASLWERFKRWLWETLLAPLGDAAMAPFWRGVLYLLVGVGVTFAVVRLLGMRGEGLFYRRRPGPAPPAFEAVPSAPDLDALLADALRAGDYRRAVHFYYLMALRTLVDRGLVVWRREKTNHDYLDELGDAPARPAFEELTLLFDYLWYGDFPIAPGTLDRMARAYERFTRSLDAA